MGRALYRKYRSKSLEEVVGQQHVTDILARSIKQGRIAHAYLLTGPRGVGKTSIARILAHEINQLPYTDESTHLDIIEIDAASNNGVEDVRSLREKVQIAPVSASKKVYIIDEVHMLSKPAFNALLKTLEEPPEHVVFILATTDVDKLPATIISRTQRFGFRSIGRDDAISHLRMIADKENITIDDESLAIIAERGDGSFRDSISLLDQLASLSDDSAGITTDLVEMTLGLAPRDSVDALLASTTGHDQAAILKLLDQFDRSGIQATVLTSQLIASARAGLATHPEFVSLLDDLLEVNKSSHPSVKLLTILLRHAAPKSKTAALAVTMPSISKPVAQLASTPVVKQAPVLAKPPVKSAAPVEEIVDTPAPKPTPRPLSGDAQPVDWQKLIDYVRQHHVALYSVLSKCSHHQDGDTLTLYTGTAFYKKKLDDAKYRPLLSESIIAIGAGELVIDTIPTPPPPTDPAAASVAALMGGGEQVDVG